MCQNIITKQLKLSPQLLVDVRPAHLSPPPHGSTLYLPKRLPLGEPARASVCSVIFGGYLWPHAAQMCCLSRSFQSMICGGKAHLQIRKPRFFASSASLNLSDLSASSSFLPASSDSSPLGSSSRTLLRISSAVLPAVKYVVHSGMPRDPSP